MGITIANLVARVSLDMAGMKTGENEYNAILKRMTASAKSAAVTVENYKRRRDDSQQRVDRLTQALNTATTRYIHDIRRMQTARASSILDIENNIQKLEAAANKATKTRAAIINKQIDDEYKRLEKLKGQYKELIGLRADSYRDIRSGMRANQDKQSYLASYFGKRATTAAESSEANSQYLQAQALRMKLAAERQRIDAMNAMGTSALRFGAGTIMAVGGASIPGMQWNQKYLQEMHNTGLSAIQIAGVKPQLEALGLESGADFSKLAEGFRKIENAGFNSAAAIKILREAMKAAVGSGGDLVATAELLAGTMRNFNVPIGDAGKMMAYMYGAANRAQLELSDFVKVGGRVFAVAKSFGATFGDASAALAVFTRHQLDANKAATQFNTLVTKIALPSKIVQERLKLYSSQTGVNLVDDFSASGIRERTLAGIFKDIEKVALIKGVPSTDLAMKLLPPMRGQQGAGIMASKNGLQEYINELKTASGTVDAEMKRVTDRYNAVLEQTQTQMDILRNTFVKFSGDLSNTMAPILTEIVNTLRDMLNVWNSLGDGTKSAITQFTIYGALLVGSGGLLLKIATGIYAIRTAWIAQSVAQEAALAGGITKAGILATVLRAAASHPIIAGLLATGGALYGGAKYWESSSKQRAKEINVEAKSEEQKRIQRWQSSLTANVTAANLSPQTAPNAMLQRIKDLTQILHNRGVIPQEEADARKWIYEISNSLVNKTNTADRTKQLRADLAVWQKRASLLGVDIALAPKLFPGAIGTPGADPLADIAKSGRSGGTNKRPMTEFERQMNAYRKEEAGLNEQLNAIYTTEDTTLSNVAKSYYLLGDARQKHMAALRDQVTEEKKATAEGIQNREKWQEFLSSAMGRISDVATGANGFSKFASTYAGGAGNNPLTLMMGYGLSQFADQVEAQAAKNKQQMQTATSLYKDAQSALKDLYDGTEAETFAIKHFHTELATLNPEVRKMIDNTIALKHQLEIGTASKALSAGWGNMSLSLNDLLSPENIQAMQNQRISSSLATVGDLFSTIGGHPQTDEGQNAYSAFQNALYEGFDAASKRTEAFAKKLEEVTSRINDMFLTMFDNLREHGFKAFFTDVLASFSNMLYQMAAQWLSSQLTQMLMGLAGTAITSLFGMSGVGPSASSIPAGSVGGGGLASGGAVAAGRSYIVGERGPELFTSNVNGTIIPNHQLGGTTVNMTVMAADPGSFNRSRPQIAQDLQREIAHALRRR